MQLPFDHIYFISLTSTLGRRSAMIKYLQESGIVDNKGNKPEWIPGNNGLAYSHQINDVGRKTKLSRSEIGCYASHLSIWKKFLQSDFENCLILEDDARLKPNASFIFDNWSKVPEYDFINFSLNSYSGLPMVRELVNKELNLWQGHGFWLTHAYSINRNCGEILLKEMAIQRGGLDWQLSQVQALFKSFAFDGFPIYQKQVGPGGSTIKHTRI